MKVLIVENADLVAQMGAEIIRELVDSKPKAVLGLATGSTPIAMYAYLVQIHKLRGLSFKEVSGFNLDEYIGLESDSAPLGVVHERRKPGEFSKLHFALTSRL